MEVTPYDSAFFDQQVSGSLSSAAVVLPLLFEHFRPASIVDVGCGVGPWLKTAVDLGIDDIAGVDGDYIDRSRLLFDERRFHTSNLNDRVALGRRFDLAICLEVAEHLPAERADSFAADLVQLSDVLLFSAAIPYQGGTNHINEQWPEYWAMLFRRHGYVPYDFLRPRIWTDSRVEFWYSQNLLVFCSEERAAALFPRESPALNRPLSYVHPLIFLVNVARYRPLAMTARDLEMADYASLLEAYSAGSATVPPLRTAAAPPAESWRGEYRPLFPDARSLVLDPKEEIQRVSAQLGVEAGEIERLTFQAEKWEAEAAELRRQLNAAVEAAGRLTAELAARNQEAAELARQLECECEAERGARAHADQLGREFHNRFETQESEIRRLSAELADAQNRLRAVYASWSWKITAPLRRAAR